MTDPNTDLLRRYFRGERFKVGATLERRIVDALADDRQVRPGLWSRRLATRAVVAIAALLIVAVGTTLPVAATTSPLASSARQILSTVGMSPVVERLMTTQRQATAGGHTVSLVGVFASSAQTIIILKVAPAAPAGSDWFKDVRLIDASGAQVQFEEGDVTPNYAWLQLAPIPGVGSAPMKVTLEVSASFGASWTLQFDITTQGRFLPKPAAGQAGKVAVTFVSVVAAPGALAVDLTTRGATLSSFCPGEPADPLGPSGVRASCVSDIPSLSKDDGAGRAGSAGLWVYDANGNALTNISPVTISVNRRMLAQQELLHGGVWVLPGPGQYRLVFRAPDGATLERTVLVEG
jgi:hypothetical protein